MPSSNNRSDEPSDDRRSSSNPTSDLQRLLLLLNPASTNQSGSSGPNPLSEQQSTLQLPAGLVWSADGSQVEVEAGYRARLMRTELIESPVPPVLLFDPLNQQILWSSDPEHIASELLYDRDVISRWLNSLGIDDSRWVNFSVQGGESFCVRLAGEEEFKSVTRDKWHSFNPTR